jgi:hypothetical protein
MSVRKATAHDVYVLIEHQVLPRLERVEGALTEAGLFNGHGKDVKVFFDRRAANRQGWQWLVSTLPFSLIAKAAVAVVGFVATCGWAVMGVVSVSKVFRFHIFGT